MSLIFGACDGSGGPPARCDPLILAPGHRPRHLDSNGRIDGASPESSSSNGVEAAASAQSVQWVAATCPLSGFAAVQHPRAGTNHETVNRLRPVDGNGHPNVPGTQPCARSMTQGLAPRCRWRSPGHPRRKAVYCCQRTTSNVYVVMWPRGSVGGVYTDVVSS